MTIDFHQHERNRPTQSFSSYVSFQPDYEELRDFLLTTTLQVDELRDLIGQLRKTDWYCLVKQRDDEFQKQESDWFSTLVACPRCKKSVARRDMVRTKHGGLFGNGEVLCFSCACIHDEKYEPRCLVCGDVVIVTKKGLTNVICDNCSNGDADQFIYYEKLRVSQQNARAQKHNLPGDLLVDEWLKTIKYFGNQCAYCGSRWDCLDHVVPLALGGGTTKTNCVPACSSCNAQKNARPLIETRLSNKETVLSFCGLLW